MYISFEKIIENFHINYIEIKIFFFLKKISTSYVDISFSFFFSYDKTPLFKTWESGNKDLLECLIEQEAEKDKK